MPPAGRSQHSVDRDAAGAALVAEAHVDGARQPAEHRVRRGDGGPVVRGRPGHRGDVGEGHRPVGVLHLRGLGVDRHGPGHQTQSGTGDREAGGGGGGGPLPGRRPAGRARASGCVAGHGPSLSSSGVDGTAAAREQRDGQDRQSGRAGCPLDPDAALRHPDREPADEVRGTRLLGVEPGVVVALERVPAGGVDADDAVQHGRLEDPAPVRDDVADPVAAGGPDDGQVAGVERRHHADAVGGDVGGPAAQLDGPQHRQPGHEQDAGKHGDDGAKTAGAGPGHADSSPGVAGPRRPDHTRGDAWTIR